MAQVDEDTRRELRKNLVRRYLFKLQREAETDKSDSNSEYAWQLGDYVQTTVCY
jgi:hypothetical protein